MSLIEEHDNKGDVVSAILIAVDRENSAKICEYVQERSVLLNSSPLIPTILFVPEGDASHHDVLSKCLDFGCPGFLNEPVTPGQLLLTLGHILRHYKAVQEAYDSTIVKEEGKAYPMFDLANVGTKMIPGLFTRLSSPDKKKELDRERANKVVSRSDGLSEAAA